MGKLNYNDSKLETLDRLNVPTLLSVVRLGADTINRHTLPYNIGCSSILNDISAAYIFVNVTIIS